MTTVNWSWHSWNEWPRELLYASLRLRSEIFVVEQNCVFPDMDGRDPDCLHLCGVDDSGELKAYLRLVPPGVKSEYPALGRVVVKRSERGTGLGRELMRVGIQGCQQRFAGANILVSAQQHLEPFYGSLGFVRSGEAYDEDGIAHVDMLLTIRPPTEP